MRPAVRISVPNASPGALERGVNPLARQAGAARDLRSLNAVIHIQPYSMGLELGGEALSLGKVLQARRAQQLYLVEGLTRRLWQLSGALAPSRHCASRNRHSDAVGLVVGIKLRLSCTQLLVKVTTKFNHTVSVTRVTDGTVRFGHFDTITT